MALGMTRGHDLGFINENQNKRGLYNCVINGCVILFVTEGVDKLFVTKSICNYIAYIAFMRLFALPECTY